MSHVKSGVANYYADLIIKGKLSIREVANMVGESKSTVHKYISNYTTGFFRKKKLKEQLKSNYNTRYIKGGAATKMKYSAHE